jgi:peptide/nickel transport system permease protein
MNESAHGTGKTPDIEGAPLRSVLNPAGVKNSILKLWRNRDGRAGLIILSALIAIAVYGYFFPPYNPSAPRFPIYLPPSASHLLGTDSEGQDIFSQFVYGSAVSLMVGFSVAAITMVIATFAGVAAGYYGSAVDNTIMRIVDVLLVIPGFPLLVILSAFFPPTLYTTVLILSILGWPFIARLIRSQTLTLKNRAFVLASKVSGLSNIRIIVKDIIPNLMPIIFINAIFVVVGAVVAQAGLAFFGLGDITSINWGTMLYWFEADNAILYRAWWWALPPGLGIVFLGIGANLLSNGIHAITGPDGGR